MMGLLRCEFRLIKLSIALAMLAIGCQSEHPKSSSESPVASPSIEHMPRSGMIDVTGGRVWYQIFGQGDGIPLLALHGGPGMTSYYLTELRRMGVDRPVIIYDQLGCGRSDRPDNPDLWTVERFVEELGQVRSALGLAKVHLLGHSWGTMLATEYMATDPEGVVSLILASPAISVERWLADANRLKENLPVEIKSAIDNHEAAGTTDSPEYQDATMAFYRRHFNRQDPWRLEMDSMFQHMGVQVYSTMWGPSEFHATGNLKNFERADYLSQIELPTLLTGGRYDEATPETVAWYASLMPDARLHIFEHSAHMAMLEEPEAFTAVVGAFIETVEKKSD